ncbi:MAG: hypothetical protein Q9206_001143 [Seirophora lacunosa]
MTITIAAAASPLRSLKSNFPSSLTVLSRLSCRRAGTRFNSRGIDDDGYVANFVESEAVLWHPSGLCFSHGTWASDLPAPRQALLTPTSSQFKYVGLLPNQQKIQITRSPEATQSAFNKHFDHLELAYGAVHNLNLMSAAKPGEVELTARYQQHVRRSPLNQTAGSVGVAENRLLTTQFDFHAETKGPGGYEAASMIRRLIQDRADRFAYLLCDITNKSRATDIDIRSNGSCRQESTVILQQEGVFRTNCLDCLDRTNLIQTIISQMALELFLGHRSERAAADFWMQHASLWADNGDALSKIYAGTGALKSSFTRHGKMSIAGAIADARKSATRLYINNFADKGRQNTIDMLLGRLVEQRPVHLYDPINDYVASELQDRTHEFSTSETIGIWVGTFNLNGKGNGVREDLSAWLCPPVGVWKEEPDIVAVGFQEIVELSPQQVMSTDPVRRQEWEEAVRLTINSKTKYASREEYVLLRSGQLVGAALIVFVKSSALKKIKNVEGSVKKTGMSGMAGNKGAVAIRMDYANTRICLVTAHLAAGFANYEERNRDYRTISHGLRFQRNRSIDDHDAIIWLGDMNYRIGLGDDKARRLIKMNDLESLYANDQLNLQMIAGQAFPYYSEARITFLPTYKYNNGTDEYDTSEKARIPAWCDRILRKGSKLKQIDYATAPLRFSDHRPVYATFECTISNVDERRKEELSRTLYEKRKQSIAGSSAAMEHIDEDVVGYRSVAAGLPPASSNRRKWWLDNGLPVRSQAGPPTNMVLNLARPSNPFAPTNEPDWVKAGRSPEARTSTSQVPPTLRGTQVTISPNARPGSSSTASFPVFSNGDSRYQAPPSPSSPLSVPDVKRKPAPPVPKKPALLSTSHVGPKGFRSRVSADTHLHASNDRIIEGSSSKGGPNAIFSSRLFPPSALGAPATPSNRGKSSAVGSQNILDEAGEGLEAIPSLQPVRQR